MYGKFAAEGVTWAAWTPPAATADAAPVVHPTQVSVRGSASGHPGAPLSGSCDVIFGSKWVWRFLCGYYVTDGDVGLFRAEDDLSEEVEFGAAVAASLDGLDFADVAFDGA
jgi:hypothetical protein